MAEKARAADGAKAGARGSVFYCKSESEASFVRYVLINFPQYKNDQGYVDPYTSPILDRYFTSLKTLISISTCGLFILLGALLDSIAALSNRFRCRKLLKNSWRLKCFPQVPRYFSLKSSLEIS